MPATIAGSHLGPDTHANRPAANAAGQPIGAFYKCTTHNIIYRTDGSTWVTYADMTSTGLTDPMTTRGDIIIRNAANATARLGIGSATKVLTSDGTDVSWQTPAGGGSTAPLGLTAFEKTPASPGAEDQEFEGTANTLPTDFSWVSSAPALWYLNDPGYPSWWIWDRAQGVTTEYKARIANFNMAATSSLWIKMGVGGTFGETSQFEWIIYDSASSNGYGAGIHNGNIWVARQSTAGTLANRGTHTSGEFGTVAWMGVVRVSNTWETWFGYNGGFWARVQTADSLTFTVDRLEFRWSSGGNRGRVGVDAIHYRADNLFPLAA